MTNKERAEKTYQILQKRKAEREALEISMEREADAFLFRRGKRWII